MNVRVEKLDFERIKEKKKQRDTKSQALGQTHIIGNKGTNYGTTNQT